MHFSKQIIGVFSLVVGAASMAHAGCATSQWAQPSSHAPGIRPVVYRPDRDDARCGRPCLGSTPRGRLAGSHAAALRAV